MFSHLAWFFLALAVSLSLLTFLRLRIKSDKSQVDLKKELDEIKQAVALGHFQHCLRKLNKLPPSKLYQIQIDLLKAQCLKGMGKSKSLFNFLQSCSIKHSNCLPLQRMLAQALCEYQEWKRAQEIYKIISSKLEKGQDLVYRASSLFYSGHAEATITLIESECLEPNGQIFSLLGHCHFNAERYLSAVDFYLKAENHGWKPSDQYVKKGKALLEIRRFEEALKSYQILSQMEPSSIDAYFGIPTALEKLERVPEALNFLETKIPQDLQESPEYYTLLGNCYFKIREYKKACHYLLNAYEQGVDHPKHLSLTAQSLEKQNQWPHAVQLYKTLINQYPEYHHGYYGIAYLFACGKPSEVNSHIAIEYAKRVIKLYPCLSAWELLSACYARVGYFEKAHEIQESLGSYTKEQEAISRRREAMRKLRKQKPLNSEELSRIDVA